MPNRSKTAVGSVPGPARPGSPAWLSVQYDNRARVPGSLEILRRWAARSAEVRASVACRLDLPYGENPSERLDLFPPRGSGAAPVLVFVHGGWWRALDKSDQSFVAPAFQDAGALVVVPNYALCPAVGIADIALQLTRALAWVWLNAAAFGGDPSRIVLSGHSAGGHLAALLATCHWPTVDPRLPAHLLQAVLALSGVYDLEPIRRTPFLQPDLRLTPSAVRRLSPAGLPAPSLPVHAVDGADESEEFHRQWQQLAAAWGPQAVPEPASLPGLNHFTIVEALATAGTALHRRASGLLGLPG